MTSEIASKATFDAPSGSTATATVAAPDSEADAHAQAYEDLRVDHPRYWLAVYHHKASRGSVGTPLYFGNRTWLTDIYMDKSPQLRIVKSAQVGLSEFVVCAMMDRAMHGLATMYVLPRYTDIAKFTPTRIDKLILKSDFYSANCGKGTVDVQNKSIKTLFGIECYFIGSNSESNFYTTVADTVIIDEVDKCDQANIAIADDRLGSSIDPHKYMLGNPTIEGTGIQAEYDASDQKVWHIKCSHCNERQPLDWFVNVVEQDDNGEYRPKDSECLVVSFHSPQTGGSRDMEVRCRRCNKSIDRLADGEWVAKHPDRTVSGYQCSRLFGDPRAEGASGLPLIAGMYDKFMAAQSNPGLLQLFTNNDLGIAYDVKGSKVDEILLGACCDPAYSMPVTCEGSVAGVDLGSLLHVHISEILPDGRRRKVFIGFVASYEDLHILFRQYNVMRAVFDAGGDIHAPRRFVADHPFCYLCSYNKSDNVKEPIQVDHVKRTVRVNRTESLDSSLAAHIDKRVIYPRDWRTIDNGELVKQMKKHTRVYEANAMGVLVPKWIGKPDHHRHADNYELIAASMGRISGSLVEVI